VSKQAEVAEDQPNVPPVDNMETVLVDSETPSVPRDGPTVEDLENDTEATIEQVNETYDAQNPDLDAFISDAIRTKKEVEGIERKEKTPLAGAVTRDLISMDEAVGYSLMGVTTVTGFLSKKSNADLNLPPEILGFAAMVFAPCVQKYGAVVKAQMKTMGDGLPLDSHVPEYLAGGGLASLGGYMLWQYKRQSPPKMVQDEVSGD